MSPAQLLGIVCLVPGRPGGLRLLIGVGMGAVQRAPSDAVAGAGSARGVLSPGGCDRRLGGNSGQCGEQPMIESAEPVAAHQQMVARGVGRHQDG